MKDLYQILGLERTSSSDEIKQAYRKLALKFHPDKNEGDKFYEDRFKQIQIAYEILGNKDKRRNYDIEFDKFYSRQQFQSSKFTSTKREEENYQEHTGYEAEHKKNKEKESQTNDRNKNKLNQVSQIIVLLLILLLVIFFSLTFGKKDNNNLAMDRANSSHTLTANQDTLTKSPGTTPSNSEPHYKCTTKGCTGTGTTSSKCPVCGSDLIHNHLYHKQVSSNLGSLPLISDHKNPTNDSAIATSQQSPAQNINGIYHYICPIGHEGGASSLGKCYICGKELVHNSKFHIK